MSVLHWSQMVDSTETLKMIDEEEILTTLHDELHENTNQQLTNQT